MAGEGKGWAKGRTAQTDPRVARCAAAHVGKTYQRHLPADRDRRYRSIGARTLPLEWSDTMAYVVGLMATDGCLSRDRRHLSFDSGDEGLVRTFLSCLGRGPRFRPKFGRDGAVSYQAQFSDVRFYRWLSSIGLHPRKSLTIGAIEVPAEYLAPLARGLFEGDGHLANFVHAPTRKTSPTYRYERLWLYFNCASRPHLEWLKRVLDRSFGTSGYIERRPATEVRKEFFRLKYGKRDSVTLLREMYPDPRVPKLERKWKVWSEYVRRQEIANAGQTRFSVPEGKIGC